MESIILNSVRSILKLPLRDKVKFKDLLKIEKLIKALCTFTTKNLIKIKMMTSIKLVQN